ncbi:MAG: helix-hairpin-helix domain-containing protein [Bacillota bacterium]
MHLGRREQLLLLLFALAVVFGLGAKYALTRQVPVEEPAVVEEEKPPEICVHVAGAVYHPGVYRLPYGSRVLDAVQKAGLRPEADMDVLNLAQVLEDGRKVVVPPRTPPAEPGAAASGNPFAVAAGGATASGSGAAAGEKVNLNTADSRALEELPGIGPALARRIIEYRTANGPFSSVDELLNVSGIGEKKLAQLRDHVTVH